MTHILATLEISQEAFDEIKELMEAYDYDHQIIHNISKEVDLDMHGIGLTRALDRKPFISHVIVRYDDTGPRSFWTGKAEWAFSVEWEDSARFSRKQDAQTVLEYVVMDSEGAKLYREKFPNDKISVELHTW